MSTSVSSVPVVDGPHPDARRLESLLGELRRRFPRAQIDRYLGLVPVVGSGALVCPGAALVGAVELGQDVSIWYGSVLRGDLAPVTVGKGSNIQDGAVLHVGDHSPCLVGQQTVVGHRVVLHGCRVEDGCLIGMQATLLDDVVIGEGSLVAAAALVTSGTVVPPRSLVQGSPARVVRPLSADELAYHRALAAKYVRLKENYLRDSLAAEG